MNSPVVSVLLPAKDAERTVERAVRSILSQTLRALELVALDDGSRDGTAAVLARLAAQDERVRIIGADGRGLVSALRQGLAQCRGRFIARMDADDESLPGRLEASVGALEADTSLAAVATGVEMVRDDRPVSPNMQLYARWLNSLTTPELLHRDRFVESPLCHPATTLRREALEAVGAWEEGEFPEDYQLWLKLLARSFRLRALPEVLFRWTDSPQRLTRTDPRYGTGAITALKARFLASDALAGERQCTLWGAGDTGLKLARALRREGVQVQAFFDVDPRKVGQRIDGAPVLSFQSLSKPEPHLIAAVGAKGAREQIRAHLKGLGWKEGTHFTCAA